tara:strand:+ start:154 stop:624 length:471 start_codon:yes stop_codon:yes gene_type:complete
MKKTILFLITLITLTNVSYASFPIHVEILISIDTLKPDTNKIVKKETTEEYHLRMEKQGFDINNCMCIDCRKFKDITRDSNKNSNSEKITLNPLQSAKINMMFLGSAMLIGLVTISIYIDWDDVPPIIFPIILTIFLLLYLRIILKKMKKESKLKK